MAPRKQAREPAAEAHRVLGRHRALLNDPLVHAWWEERSLRSRLSADSYLRHIGLFVERLHKTPAELLAMARDQPDVLRSLLVKYAAEQKKAGLLDSYIAKSFEGLKSFLKLHRVRFDEFPRLSPIRGASLTEERVPTQLELGGVLERLSQRGRVITLLLAHTGVRPGVLGSYGGEGGLRLGDLPELELDEPVHFTEIPFVVRVPAELSKTRRQYITFGTEQLATALIAYLEARQAEGEELGPESPVLAPGTLRGVAVTSRAGSGFGQGFLAMKNVVKEVQDVLHSSAPKGVRWRPYVLRSYCSTRLLLAEGQGKISRDLREAILGHDGGIASRYNVGKRWGEELLTEARREYANAAEFLETRTPPRTDVAAEFRKTLLNVAGLSEEEAKEHITDSNEELLGILRTKLMGKPADPSTPPSTGGGGTQRPVSYAEAERLMEQGWTFIANFGPDRVLVRAP